MPDLTLDEYRGFSEKGLKRMLREEAIKAGIKQKCSHDKAILSIDPSCEGTPGKRGKKWTTTSRN